MKINKKICSILVTSLMLGVVGMFNGSDTSSAAGTDRDWSLSLPHEHGNYYYPFRKKETNEKSGYVQVTKLESSGVAVWFNKGTSLKDVVRITDVVKFTKKAKKTVNYNSSSKKGSSVDMGIENSDYTWLFRDDAAGIVNYK